MEGGGRQSIHIMHPTQHPWGPNDGLPEVIHQGPLNAHPALLHSGLPSGTWLDLATSRVSMTSVHAAGGIRAVDQQLRPGAGVVRRGGSGGCEQAAPPSARGMAARVRRRQSDGR